jgi:hypothetical protein
MPDTNSRCTPFSLSLLVANKGNNQQINFGLTKGCTNDNQIFWIITFVLKQKDAQGIFFERVNFQLNVNQEAPGRVANAMNLQNGLTINQQQFVQGPMAEAAQRESQPSPVPTHMLESAALNEFSEHISGAREAAPALAEFIAAASTTRWSRPTLKQLTVLLLDIQ